MLDAAAEPVGHELVGQRADEHLRLRQDRLAQADRSVDRRAGSQLAGRVDPSTRFLHPPLADAVKVFEREAERIHDAVTAGTRRIAAMLLEQRTNRLGLLALLLLECRVDVWRRR